MLRAALLAAWDELDLHTSELAATVPLPAKGTAQMLKSLSGESGAGVNLILLAADFRNPESRDRARTGRSGPCPQAPPRFRGTRASIGAVLRLAGSGAVVAGRGVKLKEAIARLA